MTIKKVSSGYKVFSHKGKALSKTLKTRAAAKKRLRQIEFFKRRR